jgi:Ca2+-binding RTX toxin-like protein
VVIDLTNGAKNTNDAKGDVYTSIAKFIGSSHKDKFTGNSSANIFDGGSGVDTINGGRGKDTLTGGSGGDKCVFSTALGATNVDTIMGFSHSGGDRIHLDDAIFAAIGPTLSSGEFYAKAGATAAHDANDRIIYNKTNGKLLYDDDGVGGHKAVHFATLDGHPTLVAADFVIV